MGEEERRNYRGGAAQEDRRDLSPLRRLRSEARMAMLDGRPLLCRLAVSLEDTSPTVDGVSMRGMMVEDDMGIRPRSSA